MEIFNIMNVCLFPLDQFNASLLNKIIWPKLTQTFEQ